MNEQPFFFAAGERQLFGIVHEAHGEARRLGFLLLNPLAEEKLWAQRVFVSVARALAARGYPVLRFDVGGEGDSDGRFEESSVSTRLADARRAIEVLRERFPGVEGVALVGLRFGATLAALLAEELRCVRRLVLWEPVVDGSRYMQELLRVNLATQMAVYREIRFKREELAAQLAAGRTVNVDGYELSGCLYRECSAIDLSARTARVPAPCLLVQIDRPGAPLRKDLVALGSRFPELALVQVVEEPFWKEIKRFYGRADRLCGATLAWLEADAGVGAASHGGAG